MKTRAAVLRTGHGPFTVEELEVEAPRSDEVLVRMVAAGMCHTDLRPREQPAEDYAGPQVYGHEGSGVVEAVGADVSTVSVGDHVVLSFASCAACPSCAVNRPSYCYELRQLNMSGARPDGSTCFVDVDGQPVGSHYFGQSSFAGMSVVAERSVVKVDPDLDLVNLGPLGCGIQTGAGAIMNSLAVPEGSSVVVTGAGALGLSAIMATQIVGAGTVIAVDRHQSRLDLARRYGATHTILGSVDSALEAGETASMTEQILDLTGGGADVAFDTTGNAEVVRAAYEGLTFVGTLGMAGVGSGDVSFGFRSMVSGRSIRGILEGDSVPSEFIPYLAELNVAGSFPYHELIATFPLEQVNEAEAASMSGEVVKPVLLF